MDTAAKCHACVPKRGITLLLQQDITLSNSLPLYSELKNETLKRENSLMGVGKT